MGLGVSGGLRNKDLSKLINELGHNTGKPRNLNYSIKHVPGVTNEWGMP